MRDPDWIDEAAAEVAGGFRQVTDLFGAVDWLERSEEIARATVRAVLAVQDRHDCRGPADPK